MSFNENTLPAYYQAIKLMFSNKPVSQGMKELDALARSLVPHPVWNRLQKIDFEQEIPRLEEWMDKAVAQHPDNIAILFFNLSDLGDALTLHFLRQKREPAGDNDWEAYDAGLSADVPSTVLTRMAELVEAELTDEQGDYTNEDAGWIVETCYPLAYSGLVVGKIMQRLSASTLLGNDVARKVAVFFGEGDDFLLGEISPQGFTYYPVPDFIA